MSTVRLVLRTDGDFDARREFIAEATVAIASADATGSELELDCSAVKSADAVDDVVIGMLVTLARTAQRLGARVELVRVPRPMRSQLENAEVAHFFKFRR
jgi:anti-anti-sigma regulatory factor